MATQSLRKDMHELDNNHNHNILLDGAQRQSTDALALPIRQDKQRTMWQP